jgi:Arc/MetJ-type ribon-helix-helix transcriptional regulator
MKVSVSLPDEDVVFLDQFASKAGSASRSAVVHQAIRLLREQGMEEAYAAALDEWEASEDRALWDVTADDGLADAPR